MTGFDITIFDTHARVPNGLGSFKNISLEDLHAEIGRVIQGVSQESRPMNALRLPNETVSLKYSDNEVHLLMYFPAAKRQMRHYNRKYDVAMPPVLIHVQLKSNGKGGWMVENPRWFCTDMSEDDALNLAEMEMTPLNYQNHLWPLPFPNQYGDGRMCVGANSYRSLYTSDLRGLNELFYHILVASPFNDDLWGGGRFLKNSMNSGPWFKLLDEAETFPFAYLPGYPQSINVNLHPSDDGDDNDDDDFGDDDE